MGGRHLLHDGEGATWLHRVAEGAGGRGDHQHGAGGTVATAVQTWNLREKELMIKTSKKREQGPPCNYLGGDLHGEERGPPMASSMERSSSLYNAKPKKENQELILLSSSSGRFDQEGKKK